MTLVIGKNVPRLKTVPMGTVFLLGACKTPLPVSDIEIILYILKEEIRMRQREWESLKRDKTYRIKGRHLKILQDLAAHLAKEEGHPYAEVLAQICDEVSASKCTGGKTGPKKRPKA